MDVDDPGVSHTIATVVLEEVVHRPHRYRDSHYVVLVFSLGDDPGRPVWAFLSERPSARWKAAEYVRAFTTLEPRSPAESVTLDDMRRWVGCEVVAHLQFNRKFGVWVVRHVWPVPR